MKQVPILASAILLALRSMAEATLPATPEQVLCWSSYVFIGRAVSAINENAHKDGASFPVGVSRNVVNLSVEVREIVGVAERAGVVPARILKPGDRVEVVTHPLVAPMATRHSRFGYQGGLNFDAPLDMILSNEIVGRAYTSEDFLYSMRLNITDVQSKVRYLPAAIWSLEKKEWAVSIMEQVREGRYPKTNGEPITYCPVAR